ncbi:tetratricopeptide repeat protein [Thalassovita sp.]|uniref:tetratricopeptide repeat protein n=1 Tax=Thalassovita sp. TaxID=1979401 RepID=UPI0029DE757D|nr:tetratricopeptide repeat protein [Thalassovita sp.]
MRNAKTGVLVWAFALGVAITGLSMANPLMAQSAGQECRAISGVPTAQAPVSRDAFNDYFSTLARARPHCEAAVIGPEPDAEALFHLAVMMQREGAHPYALDLFEMAAQAGVPAAHTKLGDYYNFGIGGTREDIGRAVREYGKAADLGDVAAKSTMAIMYQLGRGVPRDSVKMLEVLQETADAGYHFSQYRLAELYMNPRALPPALADQMQLPDPIKAAEYYQKAAAQGSAEARAKMKEIFDGAGAFADPVIKFKLMQHAASGGDAQALNALGFLYETGDGVEFDPIKAAQHYIMALETGNLDVSQLRGRVNGYTPPWNRETALEFQMILRERELYLGPLDALVGFGTLAAARKLVQ